MIATAHTGDGQRCLTLPIELGKHGPKNGERVFQLADIHGAATVDDETKVCRPAAAAFSLQTKALNHRWRKECRDRRVYVAQIEELGSIITCGFGNDLAGGTRDVGQQVQTR